MSSEVLHGFLLSAQQETAIIDKKDINLDVYIMNNYQIKLRVSSFDCTEKVLTRALKQINLPIEYMQYFSLYLIKVDNPIDIVILRKLLDFESPYLTQQVIKSATSIVIRKNYWDTNYDNVLMTDPIALNLLYIQTVADVERGWILTTNEAKMHLEKLKTRLAKKEYIEFAQKLKYYGFMQFSQCICDYPQPQTKVLIAIGDEELSMRILGPGSLVKEGVFRVTRMRCWRITATNSKVNGENGTYSNNTQEKSSLELSFEYLMSKDKLQWITISSEQAIFMSACLQMLVDELLVKKKGIKKRDCIKSNGKLSYMKRDGSCQLISIDNSFIDSSDEQDSYSENSYEEAFSIKTLQEKFLSVSFKNGREFVENHAFEGIGDDDL
ncbi:hypothetical protein ABEB36_011073 [Hypothenemus hampei]